MIGSKKEIYVGREDDRFRQIVAKLKENGIRYDIARDVPHMSDIGRGAGVGRYAQSSQNDTVKILVRKADQESARSIVRQLTNA